jgi:hypothetical protein
MSRVESLEHEVEKLTPEELADFREWFATYDADAWDRQIGSDVSAGRLDGLAAEALAAHERDRKSSAAAEHGASADSLRCARR